MLLFSPKTKRLKGHTMTLMPLEVEEKSRHREIRWVSLEDKPSSEKMTSEDACLTHAQGILAG